jgi:hypothetical protein
VLFTLPSFLLLSIFSFTRETHLFWDSSVQYNPLVASTSLRRRNRRLPAHGRVCVHSMRCVSSAPFLPASTSTSFIFSLLFLSWTFIPSMRTAHPLSQNRIHSRFAPYIPMRPLWLSSRAPATAWSRGLPAVSMCFVPGQPAHHWCTIHLFLPPTFLWPSLALMSSAALPSFLLFLRATGPRCANPFASHLIPLRAMHNCRCVRRRGPSPFHFGLDTIRWRWRYAIRRRWGDDASCSGGTCDGRA